MFLTVLKLNFRTGTIDVGQPLQSSLKYDEELEFTDKLKGNALIYSQCLAVLKKKFFFFRRNFLSLLIIVKFLKFNLKSEN